MGRTLWIVSELYYPEETSTGRLLTQLAEGLAASLGPDWRVRAICSQPTYEARGTRAPARERRAGVEIFRCRGTTFRRDRLWRRLANVLTISGALVLRLLRGVHRGDVVLVVTNPPLLPFGVTAVCRLRGARCALIVHDVYPEVLV
ncbi:MAG TPA: hypothetical protein VEB19_02375, partial [Gemmatimonadaceae bacterium]|nr:hypothetical protein [Gemmatimonadaceae bacterium]